MDSQVEVFEMILQAGLNNFLPTKSVRFHPNDSPWINTQLKNLIQERQRALAKREMERFRSLRNLINRQRKKCRLLFYNDNIKKAKESEPKK